VSSADNLAKNLFNNIGEVLSHPLLKGNFKKGSFSYGEEID
jgi:hypothetical protein